MLLFYTFGIQPTQQAAGLSASYLVYRTVDMLTDQINRWWNRRTQIILLTAMIGYAAIQPHLRAWLESLPVLTQQAIGLLFLAAMLGFSLWYYWETGHPVGIFLATGYIAIAVAIVGGWPDISAALAFVFLAATTISVIGGPIRQFIQNRRKA